MNHDKKQIEMMVEGLQNQLEQRDKMINDLTRQGATTPPPEMVIIQPKVGNSSPWQGRSLNF